MATSSNRGGGGAGALATGATGATEATGATGATEATATANKIETCSLDKNFLRPIPPFLKTQDFSMIADKKINELLICFPHNGTTNLSHKVGGKEWMGRNQILTIPEYLDFVQFSPIIGIDIDITKLKTGELTSAHGAQRARGWGGICDASNTNTEEILNRVFLAGLHNNKSIIVIRSENNNGTNEEDILNVLETLDRKEPLHGNRPRADLIYSFRKGGMPTYNDVISSGRNIIIFLEKNNAGDFDEETGLYPRGRMMAQKCFMARTKWDNVGNLLNVAIPIETSMVQEDFRFLPNENFFIMIDYYTTILGARYDQIVKLHANIFHNMETIKERIREYFTRTGKIPPTNYMFMVDMISPEIIMTSSDKNTNETFNFLCENSEAITSRAKKYEATHLSIIPLLDSLIGTCKTFFSRSSNIVPNYTNVVNRSEESLNKREKTWRNRKTYKNVRMNNISPNNLTRRNKEISSVLTPLTEFNVVEPKYRPFFQRELADVGATPSEEKKSYLYSLIPLINKTKPLLENEGFSRALRTALQKKVENIFKHDLTISQRDALIRDMRFFISKEFKTMIGGNKKSKKKRSSRKK
jgi:hypothetical protein